MKKSKKMYYAEIVEIVKGANLAEDVAKEYLDFIAHEIELLEKKHSSTKPTKTQVENEEIKNKILEVLRRAEKPLTVTELMGDDTLDDYSNQKLSALIKQLVDTNVVEKTVDKKKSYFAIAR